MFHFKIALPTATKAVNTAATAQLYIFPITPRLVWQCPRAGSVGSELIAEWWRGPALLANRALFGRSRRFLHILFALGRMFRLDRFQLSQKATVRVFAHGDLEGAIGSTQRK